MVETPEDYDFGPDAFGEGIDAFNAGLSEEDNPYEDGSVDYDRWSNGWNEAAHDDAN